MDYEFYSRHLMMELYGVNKDLLDNPKQLQHIIENTCQCAGFTLLSYNSHKFEPQGVTAFGILSESHISIHTYPDKNSAFLDVMTCGNTNPEDAIPAILFHFDPINHKSRLIERN